MEPSTIKNFILCVFAAIGSTLANFLGGWDAALTVLIVLMVIDYLTGLAVAFIFKRSPKTEGGGVSSKVSFKGLTKKVVVLLLVGVGALLDRVIGAHYIRNLVVIFYIGTEGLSVLENTALMGVPYPAFVKKALEALREKGDSGEGGKSK